MEPGKQYALSSPLRVKVGDEALHDKTFRCSFGDPSPEDRHVLPFTVAIGPGPRP